MNTLTTEDARTLNRLRILTGAADAGIWSRSGGEGIACLMFDKGEEIRVVGETDALALCALSDFLGTLKVLTAEEIAWARNASPDPGPRPRRV